MKHCNECGVDIRGKLDNCPLCKSTLSGEASPSVFPYNKIKQSGIVALRILAGATGACLVAMIMLWQIFDWPGDIVLVSCLGLVVNFLFVQSIITTRPDFLRVVVRYFLIILAVAIAWLLISQNLMVSTYVIPGICFLALVFDAVLVSIFGSTFVSGYAKYLLFNVGLGLAPLILIALGLTTTNIPASLCALTASILLLTLALFARKQLVQELRKLLSQ